MTQTLTRLTCECDSDLDKTDLYDTDLNMTDLYDTDPDQADL